MKLDQIKWNQKFAEREQLLPPEPFLLKHLNPKLGNTLLDLASGDGRNSIYFARNGLKVTAVDISDIGLSKLEARAQSENLKIETFQADFDESCFISKPKTYDFIIINHFRPSHHLWKKIHAFLNETGRVFLCAFNNRQHELYGFPIEYCLKESEFTTLNPHLFCESYNSYFEDEKFLDSYIFTRHSPAKPEHSGV